MNPQMLSLVKCEPCAGWVDECFGSAVEKKKKKKKRTGKMRGGRDSEIGEDGVGWLCTG